MTEAREAEDACSMGEYVNLGYSRLVTLAVLFSTTLTELDSADRVSEERVGVGLLSTGACFRPGVVVGVGTTLDDLAVVGFCVGVMKDVDRTVSGSCVASGSPSGFTNVIPGATDVNIVG